MKNVFCLIICVLAISACKKDSDFFDPEQLTIKTIMSEPKRGWAYFQMEGSGQVTIDWGDGEVTLETLTDKTTGFKHFTHRQPKPLPSTDTSQGGIALA